MRAGSPAAKPSTALRPRPQVPRSTRKPGGTLRTGCGPVGCESRTPLSTGSAGFPVKTHHLSPHPPPCPRPDAPAPDRTAARQDHRATRAAGGRGHRRYPDCRDSCQPVIRPVVACTNVTNTQVSDPSAKAADADDDHSEGREGYLRPNHAETPERSTRARPARDTQPTARRPPGALPRRGEPPRLNTSTGQPPGPGPGAWGKRRGPAEVCRTRPGGACSMRGDPPLLPPTWPKSKALIASLRAVDDRGHRGCGDGLRTGRGELFPRPADGDRQSGGRRCTWLLAGDLWTRSIVTDPCISDIG